MTFSNASFERAFQRSLMNNQNNPLFQQPAYSGIGQSNVTPGNYTPEPSINKIYVEPVPIYINTMTTPQPASAKPKLPIGRVIIFSVIVYLFWKAYQMLTHKPKAKTKRDVSYYLREAQFEMGS